MVTKSVDAKIGRLMQSNGPFCLTSGLRSLPCVGCRLFEMPLRPLETNHALSLFLVASDSFCCGVVSTLSLILCSSIKNLRLQLPCQPPSSPCSPFPPISKPKFLYLSFASNLHSGFVVTWRILRLKDGSSKSRVNSGGNCAGALS